MKRLFLALLLSIAPLLPAAPISKATLEAVLDIGDAAGVPRSVARQLMIEESGGDAAAESRMVRGYRSRGLFQIYDAPANLGYLIAHYWPDDAGIFDILDPIDNATMALRYLSALHDRFGNWTQALWFYNSGNWRRALVPAGTIAYAERIVNAH